MPSTFSPLLSCSNSAKDLKIVWCKNTVLRILSLSDIVAFPPALSTQTHRSGQCWLVANASAQWDHPPHQATSIVKILKRNTINIKDNIP